jgi:hypothetical protein
MRWKLLLLAPFIATALGAGVAFGLVWGFNDHTGRFLRPDLFTWATIVWTLGVIVLVAISVYRRTSRRRRLQAAITAAASSLLCLAVFIFVSR